MNLDFVKTQSVGNDFVLLLERDLSAVAPDKIEGVLERLAIRLSDRKFGVGSDGLLVLAHTESGLRLRMFNPDGTEDFCGNGLRCAAQFARLNKLVEVEKFDIEHGGDLVQVELLPEGRVRTRLQAASYRPADVPHLGFAEIFSETVWSGMIDGMPLSLFGSALTTGSTHVVIPSAAIPDDESFVSISSAIEKSSEFPKHTSVIWVKEVEPKHLRIRIWERGAGETLGCGTGSSAAAVDYLRRKQTSGEVIVENPGGTLKVNADSWDAPSTLEGTAQIVYRGTVSAPELDAAAVESSNSSLTTTI